MEYDNFWKAFEAIDSHVRKHGFFIVSADDPHALKLGWICSSTGEFFSIRLSNFKRTMGHHALNNETNNIVLDALRTLEGRKWIISLAGSKHSLQEEIERRMKLKAFW